MTDIPKSVIYRERLAPDSPPVEVLLPQSRADAFDWFADINRLASTNPAAWKAAFRQATASDWYMLALFMSGFQRLDPFTGKPEIDCDFQFHYSREKQFDGDGVPDKSARQHGKSTWAVYVGVTNDVVNNPNTTVGLFAFEKAAAERHGWRNMNEWANNLLLKTAWDDVFFMSPYSESPLWSKDKGLILKRTMASSTPTFSWYSIEEVPTGIRLSKGIFDDCENEQTVSSEEMRKKIKARVRSVINLAGRACRWQINYTNHHPAGWGAEMESDGRRIRCHTAEDESKPAPDIAALFDLHNGTLPVREDQGLPIPLQPEVRNIRLAGEPIYLHPLECAQLRYEMGSMKYAEQMMGDSLAGQQKRLDPAWIRYYDIDPLEWAAGSNIYILIDPSKGVGDPTFARVEATKADQTISWVGGLRRKLSPSEFGPAIYQLAMEWHRVGTLIEIRVEEFAQSTWGWNLRQYFDKRNHHVCRIVSCSRHNTLNRESSGRQREWSGLEPLYRMGRRIYPSSGIWVFDENNDRYDLVDYYIKKELGLFPLPIYDDGLAADYLLAVTKGKDESGREITLSLEYPESDLEFEINRRAAGRWAGRIHRDPVEGPDDWMLES